MAITVERKENKGGVFYDITIDGLTIIGCRRITGSKNGSAYDFIAFPQRPYNQGGVVKYATIIKIADKELEFSIMEAVQKIDGQEDTTPYEATDLEDFL